MIYVKVIVHYASLHANIHICTIEDTMKTDLKHCTQYVSEVQPSLSKLKPGQNKDIHMEMDM